MGAESVFARYEPKAFPYVFRGHVVVDLLVGGIPTNPDVAEAWLRAKGFQGPMKDELLRAEVARVMEERGVSADEAVSEVSENRHLIGFKRDPSRKILCSDNKKHSELYIEGRQLKAMLKEAVSVAADVGKIKARGLGANSRKGALSFAAEHIFVREQRLYLGVGMPTDVLQSFVHTFRGSGIQQAEVVENAEFDFTVESDSDFAEEFWAALWLTGQRQGVGAMRSQSYGRFTITEWEPINQVKPLRRSNKRAA